MRLCGAFAKTASAAAAAAVADGARDTGTARSAKATGNTTAESAGRVAVEDRLRAALDARAEQIAPHGLGPARPPAGPRRGIRWVSRGAFAVVAVAAVAVTVWVVLLPGGALRPHHVPPAQPPARHPGVENPPHGEERPDQTPSPGPTGHSVPAPTPTIPPWSARCASPREIQRHRTFCEDATRPPPR